MQEIMAKVLAMPPAHEPSGGESELCKLLLELEKMTFASKEMVKRIARRMTLILSQDSEKFPREELQRAFAVFRGPRLFGEAFLTHALDQSTVHDLLKCLVTALENSIEVAEQMRIDGAQQGRGGWIIKAMVRAAESHAKDDAVARLVCLAIARLCALSKTMPKLKPTETYRLNQLELAESGAIEVLFGVIGSRAQAVNSALEKMETRYDPQAEAKMVSSEGMSAKQAAQAQQAEKARATIARTKATKEAKKDWLIFHNLEASAADVMDIGLRALFLIGVENPAVSSYVDSAARKWSQVQDEVQTERGPKKAKAKPKAKAKAKEDPKKRQGERKR